MANDPDTTPEPGTDSRVEDWFGQSVQDDESLIDELVEEMGEDQAEQAFEARSTGADEQARRHGDSIDPQQGESAYRSRADPPSDD